MIWATLATTMIAPTTLAISKHKKKHMSILLQNPTAPKQGNNLPSNDLHITSLDIQSMTSLCFFAVALISFPFSRSPSLCLHSILAFDCHPAHTPTIISLFPSTIYTHKTPIFFSINWDCLTCILTYIHIWCIALNLVRYILH